MGLHGVVVVGRDALRCKCWVRCLPYAGDATMLRHHDLSRLDPEHDGCAVNHGSAVPTLPAAHNTCSAFAKRCVGIAGKLLLLTYCSLLPRPSFRLRCAADYSQPGADEKPGNDGSANMSHSQSDLLLKPWLTRAMSVAPNSCAPLVDTVIFCTWSTCATAWVGCTCRAQNDGGGGGASCR